MSIKNKLLVRMISEGQVQGAENECVQVSAGEDTNSLHWLQISVNGVVLYGKFSESAIVDGKIKIAQYKYNRATNLVDIIVPHFWTAAEFDPDFQVLFSEEEACGSKIQKDKFTSGTIAGIAVGVVVGVALIAGAVLFVTLRARKNKTKRRLRGASNRMSSSVQMDKVESSDSFSSASMSSPTSASPLYANNERENPLFSQ